MFSSKGLQNNMPIFYCCCPLLNTFLNISLSNYVSITLRPPIPHYPSCIPTCALISY